jgi:hypothetical protein
MATFMAPEELRDTLKQQPFEPFRIVLTDGKRKSNGMK